MDVLEPTNPRFSQAWREQIAPGRIWKIDLSSYDLHAIQAWFKAKFTLALTDLPRYVLILERPDSAKVGSPTVFVMLLSQRSEYLSDQDLLIPAQVSGLPTDLLAQTWNTLPMLECYLMQPVGKRLSRKIYDILLDVADYYQGNLHTPPDLQRIEAVSLGIQRNASLNHPRLHEFHQQQEELATLLQFSPEHYQDYRAVINSTEELLETVLQDEGEIRQIIANQKKPEPKQEEECYQLEQDIFSKKDDIRVCFSVKSRSSATPNLTGIPTPAGFFGRRQELAHLRDLLYRDRCRILLLTGDGGIGKTSLAAKLIEENQQNFDYIIWCSLRNAPPIEEIVNHLLNLLPSQAKCKVGLEDFQTSVVQLVQLLEQNRCLVVFDNVDSLSEIYRDRNHYEQYGEFLKCMGAEAHDSCLMLTSRDELSDLLQPIAEQLQILRLEGIGKEAGIQVCQFRSVPGSIEELAELVEFYQENPLAIQIAASVIQDTAKGQIQTVLRRLRNQSRTSHTSKSALIHCFQYLSELEKTILYCLSISREPLSILELHQDLVTFDQTTQLQATVESLVQRSLVEPSESKTGRFSLHPVVMDYATEHFIETVCREIISGNVQFLDRQFLFKAQAKDYIKTIQSRLLIQPLIAHLEQRLGNSEAIYQGLIRLLTLAQRDPKRYPGYLSGNCLNVLVHLQPELQNCDFSNLTIRQADLQGATLKSTNLTGANLKTSIFAKSLGGVLAVAFHPQEDWLATGDTNGSVHLWQIADGEQRAIYKQHTGWVRTLAFSPCGQLLATGGDDKTVYIRDIKTGQCLHCLKGHTRWIRSVAFSPNGTWLVTSSDDCTLCLWDVKTGTCIRVFRGHTGRVRSVAFHPDGTLLASGGSDKTLRFWDVSTGTCLRVLEAHSGDIRSIAFSSQTQLVASGSSDRTVKLWDVQSGRCIRQLKGHTSHVRAIAFSPDGTLLASSSEDQTIRLWDVRTGDCCVTLQGHTNWIRGLAFSPDGQMLASGSSDHTVKLWDVEIWKCLRTIRGYTDRIWSVAFSPDGQFLATGSEDQTLRLWSFNRKQCVKQLKGHTNWIRAVAYSSDGRVLASGGHDTTVRLWDVQTGLCLHRLQGHTGRVRSVVFHPNGQLLASGAHDATIRLWDVQTGQCLSVLEEHDSRVRSLAFHPKGQLLASGAHDATIRLWDVQTGQCCRIIEANGNRVAAIAFSPTGDLLASGGEDQMVSLWNINTGECLTVLQGHASWIQSIAFSPDGQFLASASEDRNIILWKTSSWEPAQTLHGHENWVRSIAFSPDSQILASASEDETIRLWDVKLGSCVEILRNSRPYEGTRITRVKGLTDVQKAALIALGAIEETDSP